MVLLLDLQILSNDDNFKLICAEMITRVTRNS